MIPGQHPVLIVDDECLICDMVISRLARLNLTGVGEVRSCESGEQAAALCRTYKPHLVLTDIRMGGMDGIELIERLSKALHPVRFIVLSGYDDFDLVRRAFTAGAFDYVLKPVVPEALQRVVEAALSSLDMDISRNGLARHELFELGRGMIALAGNETMRDEEKKLILKRIGAVIGPGPLTGMMFGFSYTGAPKDGTVLVNAAYDALEGRRALCGISEHGRLFVLLADGAASDETVLAQALAKESGAGVLAGAGGPGTLDALAVLYGQSAWALMQRAGPPAMALPDQIKKYIEQNYAQGITLAQVAQQFNISYTHLSKLFKMQFNMPFIDYLTNVRMQKAMNLLSSTPLNIQEVAARCGYDNVFHFSRAFKKRFGVAPSYYRKSQQGQ